RREIPTMSPNKLTDTQLVLLSAASQREDRAIDLAGHAKSERAVSKLLKDGLVEEVAARGTLPIWHHDVDRGPLAFVHHGSRPCRHQGGRWHRATRGAAIGRARERSRSDTHQIISERGHGSEANQQTTRRDPSQDQQARAAAKFGKARAARFEAVPCDPDAAAGTRHHDCRHHETNPPPTPPRPRILFPP